MTSLKIEPIIRQGLKRYTDQIGVLWNSMADYYIRGGHFERVIITFVTFVMLINDNHYFLHIHTHRAPMLLKFDVFGFDIQQCFMPNFFFV